ncbi:MICOS complex subunit MIC13 isoform X1 [Prionailurus bengalensis]|uniref:MICOS complex subunit MIC13 isoform X1 n=1 Tax=Prionailurus bengalensis TaxID=37029 RepID=UPI001CAA2779|nr:MICOS complex subunit MIC13 isoform X1 [Prionailurus bengalensis]
MPPRGRGWISRAPTSSWVTLRPHSRRRTPVSPSRPRDRARRDYISQESLRPGEPSGASRGLADSISQAALRLPGSEDHTSANPFAVGPPSLSGVSEPSSDFDSRRPLRPTRVTTFPRGLCGAATGSGERVECPCARSRGTMVPRVWSLMRFLIKGSVAGGAVYLVYDQELLGPSDKSQAVLQKAEEVVPPALYQFSQYVCEQTGLKIPQLPAPPKFNFHIRDSWNSGIIKVMSALSAAPSKACEYSREGWDYLKERIK